jgi:type II secretory pathway pseudopilin PulG
MWGRDSPGRPAARPAPPFPLVFHIGTCDRFQIGCLGGIMRPTLIGKSGAFTLIELIVTMAVIFVVSLLLAVALSAMKQAKARSIRTVCIWELKTIGEAYGIWASDGHNGRFPASESVTNGGWRELLTNADQGFLCWTNYAIMANEMGRSPRILQCPSDERQPAVGFIGDSVTATGGANSHFKDNLTLSYFVGVSADQSQPQSLLAGDRNLGGGTRPGDDCGFSPTSGNGNDVAISTNSNASPVCWSLKMHSQRKSDGVGNILLANGSVQTVSTLSFRAKWQPVAGQTTNWPAGHVPSSPSIRVLFP